MKIKLQVFFILLKIFNTLYYCAIFWSIRYLMLTITGTKIGKHTSIQVCKFFGFGNLTVGDNVVINSGCYIDNRRPIDIGNNVVIAHNTKIYTLGHDINDSAFKTKAKPVVIEDFAVLFSNVIVLPGVTIGKGAVILPGSVISRNVEPMAVMGGNPAKKIRERENLHTDKSSYRYFFSI
jgi:acetyltransferase-like isoleucine patch superfamily enzyme